MPLLLVLRTCQTRVLKTELSLPSNYVLDFQKLCGVHTNSAQWPHTGWLARLRACTRVRGSTLQPRPGDKCRQSLAVHSAHRLSKEPSPGDYTLQAPNSEAAGVTIYCVWQKQARG